MENIRLEQQIVKLNNAPRSLSQQLILMIIAIGALVIVSFMFMLSVGIGILQNQESPLMNQSSQILILGGLMVIYLVGAAIPPLVGMAITSALTAIILLLFIGALVAVGFHWRDQTFTGEAFLVIVGSILAWLGELVAAVVMVTVYSYDRVRGVSVWCGGLALLITGWVYFIAQLTLDPTLGGDNTDIILACLGMNILLGFSLIIAYRSIQGHNNFQWLFQQAIALGAIGGISFKGLDLSDHNLDGLDLAHTNFTGAKLYHTSFRGAKNLRFAQVDQTILADPLVQKLLTSDRSEPLTHLDCQCKNLSGADLSQMNLELANFTGCNLSGVNFSHTKLKGVNFSHAQLFDANLTGADLTGAVIEDWAINHGTCFAEVNCDYVYLEKNEYGPQERKPDIGDFRRGEFTLWLTKLQYTIDLILKGQPNIRALAQAIQRVGREWGDLHPEEFSVESKGHDTHVIKIGTNPTADKSKLAQAIVVNYHAINELNIQGSDHRLFINPTGEFMESQHQNINAGGNVDLSQGTRVNIGGDVTGSSLTLGDLNGQVRNTIQNLKDIEQGGDTSLADVLATLQQAINGENLLSEDQKTQAMEAIATLTEEAQKSQESRTPKLCSMAINALKGITSMLPDVAKLAEVMKIHLPTLMGLLGL